VLLFLTVGKLELFMMTHTISCSRSSGVIRGLSQGGKRLSEGGQLVTVDEPISQNSENVKKG